MGKGKISLPSLSKTPAFPSSYDTFLFTRLSMARCFITYLYIYFFRALDHHRNNSWIVTPVHTVSIVSIAHSRHTEGSQYLFVG